MVIGLGGVVVDRSLVIPDIPGWDTVLHAKEYSTQQGGMVATAMATCARLGVQAEFVGAIGDDSAGGFIMKQFIENRVSCPRIKVMENRPSACSICLVNSETGTRTIIHYKGVQSYNSLDMDIDLRGKKVLHLDGYWPETAVATAIKAKSEGVAVVLDPSSSIIKLEMRETLLANVDYFIPGFAFGKKMTGYEDPGDICKALYRKTMKAVVLTHGEHGCYIYNGSVVKNIPAFQIGAKDTTGAGDVFHGAFIAGLIWDFELEKNCIFSHAAAALKCGHVGGQAGIPHKHEVLDFLKSKNISV